MPGRRALSRLDRVVAAEAAHVAIAQVDWSRIDAPAASPPVSRRSPTPKPAAQPADGLARLRDQPASLVRPALLDLLSASVRRVLGLAAHIALDPSAPLKSMGLDSLMAIELRNELARIGGIALPATLAFDLPTLDALAVHLAQVWKLPVEPKTAAITYVPQQDDGLDDLSDEDAEALLVAELDALAEERTAVKVSP